MNRLRYSIPGEIHEEYEDSVHDAFKKIAEKYTWEMAMDEQNLGLILRTARNCLLDSIRHRSVVEMISADDERLKILEPTVVESIEERIDLSDFFLRFSQETEELILYENYGMTTGEIAESHQLSQAAVHKRIQRSRKLAKKHLSGKNP